MINEFNGQVAPLPYDPTWLLELAKDQLPDEPDIHTSIKKCTTVVGFCDCGCGDPFFIDPESKNYHYDYSIVLENSGEFDVILDVLKDRRIGCMEFLYHGAK